MAHAMAPRATELATALWSGAHGICMLAVTGKLQVATQASVQTLLDVLLDGFLGKSTAAAAARAATSGQMKASGQLDPFCGKWGLPPYSSVRDFLKNRPVFAWALYDWANSAFATTVMAGFFPVFFQKFWSTGVAPTVTTSRLGLRAMPSPAS